MSSAVMPAKKTRNSILARGIGLALIIVPVVILFGAVWWRMVHHTPVVSLPPGRMPLHNGYQMFLRANGLVSNAAALDNMQFQWGGRRVRSKLRPLRDRERVLDANRAALAVVDAALKLEYCQPPTRFAYQEAPVYRFRRLARLLALRANVRTEHGDWPGAVDAALDRIAFSESLLKGAGVDTVQSALSQSNAALFATVPVEHLNAQQLRAAMARLETIISQRIPFTEILTEEKWSQLSLRDEMLSNPDWRQGLASATGVAAGAPAQFAQLRQQANWFALDKRHVLLEYNRYMDNCIGLARASTTVIPMYPAPPPDPVNQQLAADITGSHQRYAVTASEDAQLLLRIALQLYRVEHGAYPPNLEALVPTVLARLPEDPLGANGKFLYRLTGKSYSLGSAAIRVPQNPGGDFVMP